jgi:23S rRNA (uridine2552-2'-O)-methyltransferase
MIIALDLNVFMAPPGTIMIQGDIAASSTFAAVQNALAGRLADVVLSDMAPNATGNRMSDTARSHDLCMHAFRYAQKFLKPGGVLLTKLFVGGQETGSHSIFFF